MTNWFRIWTILHSAFFIRHFPASLGPLFRGRDDFLAELRQHLTAEGPVVIKGKRTIHGMGGVKTLAAIEYAWKHTEVYRALLFISADTAQEQSTSTLQFAHKTSLCSS